VAELVLASSSPRRRELLERLGRPFVVRVPDVDESVRAGEGPADYVERLARSKALAVPAGPDDLVVAADTTVVVDGDILGKPVGADEAMAMLRRLSGRQHLVCTGVAVRLGDRVAAEVSRAVVRLASLDDADLAWYVSTGEPLDKAGAYALQGLGGRFVTAVDGDVQAVVGLPLAALVRLAAAVTDGSWQW
jgi:septum formation protein